MTMIHWTIVFFYVALLPVSAHAQDARAKAEVSCKALPTVLNYECAIKLLNARTSKPLSDAEVMVSADMPSMPGAHAVKPIKAEAIEPGLYIARLELEMHGDWALRLDLSGPLRDRIITVLRFEDKVTKPGPRGRR